MRRSLLLGVLVIALAGCGDDDDAEPKRGGTSVAIVDTTFEPETLEVRVGQTVRWTNEDSIVHNVTADAFRSENLEAGQSFEWKADKAGTFHYVCTIHPGQEGDVVVKR